jgi:calcineurin-like phosphoesterase family protein
MPNIFIISDTHFGHANILNFKNYDGSKVRDFKDVVHMNEYMIERWNSVVRTCDKVYHLGDVVMARQDLDILARCNGHKRLVRGNHDCENTGAYLKYFDEVYGSRVLDKMILTHIPIHPMSLGRFLGNIHGHIHGAPVFGPQYFNASVEAIDYTPISLEDIKKRLK